MTEQPASPPNPPGAAPEASVVVVAYRGAAFLPACLRSLLCQDQGVTFEVIVVDNGSPDNSAEIVARDFPGCRLIKTGENLGFAGGNNAGLRAARGKFFVLLNQDTEVPPRWLAQMLAPFGDDARIGVVGCKLLYPDRTTLQHAGGVVYPNGNTAHYGNGEVDRGQYEKPGHATYVTGAAMAVRREAAEQVGLLDEGFFPAYFEEMDWETRMYRAGWAVWYVPTAGVVHHESQVLGAMSARFVYLYTRHRLRFVALNGSPGGWRRAVPHEIAWFFRDMFFSRRCWPVLKAYVHGLVHWTGWRRERAHRPRVPRLANR